MGAKYYIVTCLVSSADLDYVRDKGYGLEPILTFKETKKRISVEPISFEIRSLEGPEEADPNQLNLFTSLGNVNNGKEF